VEVKDRKLGMEKMGEELNIISLTQHPHAKTGSLHHLLWNWPPTMVRSFSCPTQEILSKVQDALFMLKVLAIKSKSHTLREKGSILL
jgi:hypothetical protein